MTTGPSALVVPDYDAGLANLVASIAAACGGPALPCPPLAALPPAMLVEARTIVLVVADGLGHAHLVGSPAAALHRHLHGGISSVFPSTTASAVTTLMTGLPPSRHALTGWHMYIDEVDATLAILPLAARGTPAAQLPPAAELPGRLFGHPPLFAALPRASWAVSPATIADSPFNRYHTRGATTVAYRTLDEMIAAVAALIHDPQPKYVYAYWPELDAAAHRAGVGSDLVAARLEELDRGFATLLDAAAGGDAWIVLTADHGFVDSPPEHLVCLDDHPELAAMLARPLCGERRVAYCYLKPGREADFVAYVGERLGHCATPVRSADLVAAGWFGPGPADPRLARRIGDFTLLMADDWTIVDWLPGEKRYALVGVHGGTSAAEMRVPLVAARV